MRLVNVDVIKVDDTIAISRTTENPPGLVEPLISDSLDLIKVTDIQHGDNTLAFPTRITGTNLVNNYVVGIRVPAGTILMCPDPREIVLTPPAP